MRFQKQSSNTSPRADLVKAVAGVVLILLISIGYVGIFSRLGQLIDYTYFWILSLVLGILAGGAIGYYFSKTEYELFEQVRIYVICGVLGIVLMPMFVFVINRQLDFRAPRMQKATLEMLKPSTDQPFGYIKGEEVIVNSYKLILLMEENIFRFTIKENPYPNAEVGDQVLVPVYAGALGISYVQF